jgi:Protein kinase domain
MTLDQREVIEALPQYEVGIELGRGGWGVVLAGRHRQLGRDVAIKQLPRAFAADASVRARFVEEARLLASLDHPHIVPIYDFVERDGLCLLVMEQLPGGTLWSRFSTDGFTPPAAAAAVLATIAGLQAAHEHRILHRDVKPENLMFSSTGALKVTDFGIAKVVGGAGTLATRAGEVVGTPAYIAPEQARGGDLSPATDVYAVATMFYELLSGQLPFTDDAGAMALLFKHAFETPTPLRERAPFVPEEIAQVVMRGLATDPADRYDTAEAFGLAVAEACTSAWGPGWLAAEGTPVMGASAIVSATDRVTAAPRPPTVVDAAPVVAPNATPAKPTIADAATVSPPAPPAAPKPPTVATPAAAPPAAPVRPTIAGHSGGVQLQDVQEADLVPVQAVLIPPARATLPLVLTVVGLILVVLVAFLGIGSTSTGGDIPPGTVTVAGAAMPATRVVELDLSKPVPIEVTVGAPTADRVRLSLDSLGQHLSQNAATLVPAGAGQSASIDAASAQYLAGGRLSGEIELLKGGAVVGHQRFGATTSQSGLLTAAGVVTILVLLFAAAYAESFARSLRKGRRIRTGTIGMGIMGGLIGAAIVSLMWVVGLRSPSLVTIVACALLGAGTGVAAAVTAVRFGKGRRYARLLSRRAP